MKEASIQAKDSMKSKAEKHRKIILDTLKRENKPMTSEMISTKCWLSYHQVARRNGELERSGHIRYIPAFGKTSTGRTAGGWQAVTAQTQLPL